MDNFIFPYDLEGLVDVTKPPYNADNTGKRSIFNKSKYFVTHRRDNALDNLKKHNSEESLCLCHAENLSGFVLTFWNAFNSATVNFGKITSVVNDKGDYRCNKRAAVFNVKVKV